MQSPLPASADKLSPEGVFICVFVRAHSRFSRLSMQQICIGKMQEQVSFSQATTDRLDVWTGCVTGQ